MLNSQLPKNNNFLIEFAAIVFLLITAPFWFPLIVDITEFIAPIIFWIIIIVIVLAILL